MAAKRRNPSGPRWQVILENIESQIRLALEHGEMTRAIVEQEVRRLDGALGSRVDVLDTAFGALQGEVRVLRGDIHTLQGGTRGVQTDVRVLVEDIRTLQGEVSGLSGKVDTLVPLNARVTAIEKRLG